MSWSNNGSTIGDMCSWCWSSISSNRLVVIGLLVCAVRMIRGGAVMGVGIVLVVDIEIGLVCVRTI